MDAQYQTMFTLCAGNRNTHKEGKLVRILARSRHRDSARPVVELVGERLDMLRQHKQATGRDNRPLQFMISLGKMSSKHLIT